MLQPRNDLRLVSLVWCKVPLSDHVWLILMFKLL